MTPRGRLVRILSEELIEGALIETFLLSVQVYF